jgi:integrase
MPLQSLPQARVHKSTGQLRVRHQGRDLYFGPSSDPASHEKFERWRAELLVRQVFPEARVASVTGNAGPTVNAIILAYLKHAEVYYQQEGQPGPEFVAMKSAAKPLKELYGSLPAEQFGPLALRAVREQMIEAGRCCRKEINKRIQRIRRIFKWAVSMELVSSSVHEALRTVEPLLRGRTVARETEPVLPVPLEHVDAILPFVTPQVAAMIQLQKLTGMRPGEVVRMQPRDIDRTRATWVYTPREHKTKYREKIRQVPLGPQARQILLPFLDRAPEAYLFSPIEAEEWRNQQRALKRDHNRKTKIYPCELRTREKRMAAARRRVSKRPKRDRYDSNSYAGAIEYAIQKANKNGVVVPAWHPNQIRHTNGTAVREKYGLDAAQAILGHSHADVTQV